MGSDHLLDALLGQDRALDADAGDHSRHDRRRRVVQQGRRGDLGAPVSRDPQSLTRSNFS
jgi:hypothetical protein